MGMLDRWMSTSEETAVYSPSAASSLQWRSSLFNSFITPKPTTCASPGSNYHILESVKARRHWSFQGAKRKAIFTQLLFGAFRFWSVTIRSELAWCRASIDCFGPHESGMVCHWPASHYPNSTTLCLGLRPRTEQSCTISENCWEKLGYYYIMQSAVTLGVFSLMAGGEVCVHVWGEGFLKNIEEESKRSV